MIGGNCKVTPRKSAGEVLVRVLCGAVGTVVLRKSSGTLGWLAVVGRVDVRY